MSGGGGRVQSRWRTVFRRYLSQLARPEKLTRDKVNISISLSN